MKFIVDAQLPRRLAQNLTKVGHDAIHRSELAKGNRESDAEIIAIATLENRVVVTKDEDFVTIFLLKGAPPKLLLISTGNIPNDTLLSLVSANLDALVTALTQHDFVELSRSAITTHS